MIKLFSSFEILIYHSKLPAKYLSDSVQVFELAANSLNLPMVCLNTLNSGFNDSFLINLILIIENW